MLNCIQETHVNLRNKVARGGFSAAFFVQCLDDALERLDRTYQFDLEPL